jgi:hypothetical protein
LKDSIHTAVHIWVWKDCHRLGNQGVAGVRAGLQGRGSTKPVGATWNCPRAACQGEGRGSNPLFPIQVAEVLDIFSPFLRSLSPSTFPFTFFGEMFRKGHGAPNRGLRSSGTFNLACSLACSAEDACASPGDFRRLFQEPAAFGVVGRRPSSPGIHRRYQCVHGSRLCR